MVDLFAGMGGASRAMRERAWEVVTVDLEPRFATTITGDLCSLSIPSPGPVDLLWASPPCHEFSREDMPWSRTGRAPSLACIEATLRHVEELRPRFWCLENVRGARPWVRDLLGPPMLSTGPVYLWGRLPAVLLPRLDAGWKQRITSARPDLRACLPYELSRAFALAVERA